MTKIHLVGYVGDREQDDPADARGEDGALCGVYVMDYYLRYGDDLSHEELDRVCDECHEEWFGN